MIHRVTNRPHLIFAVSALLIGVAASILGAPAWEATLTKDPPGNFPEPRPVRTTYHFGWSGITAGKGDIRFSKSGGKRFQLEATGGTIGFARALWKLDATYHGTANAETLHPIESTQVEAYRKAPRRGRSVGRCRLSVGCQLPVVRDPCLVVRCRLSVVRPLTTDN